MVQVMSFRPEMERDTVATDVQDSGVTFRRAGLAGDDIYNFSACHPCSPTQHTVWLVMEERL